VTAGCGVYVVPADEDEDVWDSILIWEDFPPPDEYTTGKYGAPVKGGSGTNADGEGNIPIDISPSKASGKKQPAKKLKIDRKDTKKKAKEKLYWTISVNGTSTILQDYLERYQTQVLTVQITKAGGKTLEGDYYGNISNIRTDDYSPHFAKWPDHSYCSDGCNQLWDEFYNNKWNKYLYMNGLGRDFESDIAIILEWELSRTIRYENYYANPKTKSLGVGDPILTIGKGSTDSSSLDDFMKFSRENRDENLAPLSSKELARFTAEFIPLEKEVSIVPTNLGNWNSTSIELMVNSSRHLDFVITEAGTVIVSNGNHTWYGTLSVGINEKPVEPSGRAMDAQNEKSESWDDIEVKGEDEPPKTGLAYNDSDGWPTEYLPDSVPKYPEGNIHATGDARQINITVTDTSKATLLDYIEKLKKADWTIEDIADTTAIEIDTYGRKGYWLIEIFNYNSNVVFDFTYQHA